MTEKIRTLVERANEVLSPALTHVTTLEIVKGKGIYLYDKDGREYIDFATGIAVTNVGHCHPKVIAAIERQAKSLIHACAGIVYYEQNVAFAEKLAEIAPSGLGMTFFTQSGTESVEAAIKLAKYVSKNQALIAFQGSFHGRTLGALSVTFSNPKYRQGYEPLIPGVYSAPYPYCYRCEKKTRHPKPKFTDEDFPSADCCGLDCLKDVKAVIAKVKGSGIAAVIIEPIQGEGGYIVPPKEFIRGLRSLCDDNKIFLIFDEVQTGFGRTGKMFAAEHYGLSPDIMTVAKGIASGLPLGACIAKPEIMKQWSPGAHGSTMSGNPVTCSAGLATIEVLTTEKLIDNSAKMGRYMKQQLKAIAEGNKIVGDVRGTGLMIGVEFVNPQNKEPDGDIVKKIQALCLKDGLILLACGSKGQVIRLVPALSINKEQIDRALGILKGAIEEAPKVK
jgi:4-aminobutyrate aminotransferase